VLNIIAILESKIEAAETQRRKDAEKAQEQRKKDAEIAETQRRKDAEKAEEQRKKDVEKAEEQRKKDQADAKEQTRKLKMDIMVLENKIGHLEKHASEYEFEQKQKDKATQQYIESLADDIEATTDFLAVGVRLLSSLSSTSSNIPIMQDEAGLDRIKRRNLLDRAQALLAVSLGLGVDHRFASINFREALGPSSCPEEREERLLEILMEKKDEINPEAMLLMTKPAALNLLADRFPKVRLHGDQVAHGYRQRSWYEGSVARSVGTDKVALMGLLDFIFPVGQ